MAMHLLCYTTIEKTVLQLMIEELKKENASIFGYDYLIYNPFFILHKKDLNTISDLVKRYNMETKILISEEFGLNNPLSYFSIAMNNKASEVNFKYINKVIKYKLGFDNVIVVLNNEVLIE